MNVATVAYVVLGGLAGSVLLGVVLGRLLKRLRLQREAAGERPETTVVNVVNVRDLDAESLERIWEQVASRTRPPRQRSPLICGPAGTCAAHQPDDCRAVGACCPTCPTS